MARLHEGPQRFHGDLGLRVADEGINGVGPERTRIFRQHPHDQPTRRGMLVLQDVQKSLMRHGVAGCGQALDRQRGRRLRVPAGILEQLFNRRFFSEMPQGRQGSQLHPRIGVVGILQNQRQIFDGQTASAVGESRHTRQWVARFDLGQQFLARQNLDRRFQSGPDRLGIGGVNSRLGSRAAVQIQGRTVGDHRQMQFPQGGRENGHLLVCILVAADGFSPLVEPAED